MTIPVEDGRVPLSTSAPEGGKGDWGSGFEPAYELSEGWTGTRLDRPKLDERKIDDEVDRIGTERQARSEELAKLEECLQAKLQLAAQRQQLEEMWERIDTGFDHLSFEEKREVLQAFGLRVRVREDRC